MQKKSHSVQVVSFWDSNRTDWLLGTTIGAHSHPYDYEVDDISVHRLGLSWAKKAQMFPWLPIYYPLMSVALPRLAKVITDYLDYFARNADLIHNVRIGREGLTYASWKVARKRDIPFILTPVHHPRWVGWLYKEYNKLYKEADAVIALTPSEKEVLTGLGVSQERIHVTGHAPILAPPSDAENFREKYQLNGPVILFLGQHYLYKGYRQLAEAARSVWDKVPEAQFVFVGPSVQKSEAYFKEVVDSRIHRLGTLNFQEKTDALAACDILCVPSLQESFGGVYTEAWSFSKPVIGCNIPAVADVVSDGVDGYLVEQNPDSIAEKLIELLMDPVNAQVMGRAGKEKVEARYTWPKLAEKTLQVYQAVC